MKKYSISVLIVILAALPINVLAAILTTPISSGAAENAKRVGFLFVILSKESSIEIANKKEQEFILTLNEVNPQVIYFTDRPTRFSGQIDMQTFLKQWSQGSFKKEPPQAAIEAVRVNSIDKLNQSMSYAIVLYDPVYHRDTNQLQFKIRLLPGNKMALPDLGHSDYVALFINDPDLDCMGR